MSSRFGRREFLKHSAGVAALAAGASVVGAPAVLAERSPNSKLNMVCIGANGRGMAHVPVAAGEHLVGLVDIDDRRMGATLDWLDKNVEWDGANMRCTNLPELNPYVRREYRKGWSL